MTATITVHGGLTGAPELRYSQNGTAICSGTVASTDRYLDKQTNEWRDGKRLFLRWSAFKDIAENIAATGLDKGAQVVVTGKLHTREFETRDGEKRSSLELEVTDFAVSLRRATAQVTRSQRPGGAQDATEGAPVGAEPWGAGNVAQAGAQRDGWASASYASETPF